MKRIVVVGTSGSGKTTTAHHIAAALNIPHTELDALHWEPDWQVAPTDVMRERVKQATAGNAWVIDGNYSKVRDLVWARADTIVWLNYPLYIILWRLTKRTLWRTLTRENLWGTGNRETLWTHFFTRDSLYLWVFKTYKRRRREYPELFKQPEYAHLSVHILTSPRAADDWLAQLRERRINA